MNKDEKNREIWSTINRLAGLTDSGTDELIDQLIGCAFDDEQAAQIREAGNVMARRLSRTRGPGCTAV